MNPFGRYHFSISNTQDAHAIEKIGRALSSQLRIAIIRQLANRSMTISELASVLGTTNANVIFHLGVLEEAKLILMDYRNSRRGTAQVYHLDFHHLAFSVLDDEPHVQKWQQSLPVGMYAEADFYGNVRFASTTDFLAITAFDAYNSLRADAQLMGADGGKVTYAFGNEWALSSHISELEISLECCSEVIMHRNSFKSDLTLSINGRELATYTAPGDYGDTRGRLNPSWWPDGYSQYGDLVTLSVTEHGVFLNGEHVRNDITVDDLHLSQGKSVTFTVETKRDAKHYGGFNIFGKAFGNHPQDVVLTATCKKSD